jgi:hypothetical protein
MIEPLVIDWSTMLWGTIDNVVAGFARTLAVARQTEVKNAVISMIDKAFLNL